VASQQDLPQTGNEYLDTEAAPLFNICQLAENQDCLDIIKQVDAREAAGIKAEKLPLTFERENG
jgi:hypothetical protein